MTLGSLRSRGAIGLGAGRGETEGKRQAAALGVLLPLEAQGGGPGPGWAGRSLTLGRLCTSGDVRWHPRPPPPVASPASCLPSTRLTCSRFGQTRPHSRTPSFGQDPTSAATLLGCGPRPLLTGGRLPSPSPWTASVLKTTYTHRHSLTRPRTGLRARASSYSVPLGLSAPGPGRCRSVPMSPRRRLSPGRHEAGHAPSPAPTPASVPARALGPQPPAGTLLCRRAASVTLGPGAGGP